MSLPSLRVGPARARLSGCAFGDRLVEAVQHRVGHQSVRAERGGHQNPLCACEFGNAIGDPTVGKEPRCDNQSGGAALAQNLSSLGERRIRPGRECRRRRPPGVLDEVIGDQRGARIGLRP